ncbi:MAG: prolipoprotein diacylglyceryl transferase, partial [Methyloversatilis sp.]|nr:prolipoprotein diacylglyceryl transferase [Methyloversatilis sp.]
MPLHDYLIHPTISPIAFEIGPLAVRWYGLMYLVAFVAFMLLGRVHAKRLAAAGAPSLDAKQIDDLLFYGVLGVVLGGRLGYVLFYKPAYYLEHWTEIPAIWSGGMSFHGGFLGVLVAVALFARRADWRFFQLTDFIAPLVPLGLAAGRIGNFLNAELVGRVTDVP